MFQLQISPAMRTELVSNHFLRHRGVYTIGVELALIPLLRIASSGVPVSTAYGNKDSITPLHQGQLIEEIASIPVFEVDGAGHVPYIINSGHDFAKVCDSNNMTATKEG